MMASLFTKSGTEIEEKKLQSNRVVRPCIVIKYRGETACIVIQQHKIYT